MAESDILEALFKATFSAISPTFNRFLQQWDIPRYTNIYRSKLLEWHGTTRILGKLKPIPLDNIFTDVYVWETPQARSKFTEEMLEAEHRSGEIHRENEREDGIVLLEKYRKLFVLGKPGAGKTTFLKWVTLRCADRYLQDIGIPFFISLKELADAERKIIEQIHHILDLCQIPNPQSFAKALLNSGNAVIMLDGLDEVQKEEGLQDDIVSDMRDFVRKYNRNRYLITCRTANLTRELEGFQYVEMADFTPEQIKTYVTRYFEDDTADAQACIKALEATDHQNLRDMAKSPLLLSLLCLNYEENGAFPHRRADLYEDALTALFKRWNKFNDVRRHDGYKQIPDGRKPHLYARIAYQNFVEGKVFIKSKELIPQIEKYLLEAANTLVEVDGEDVLHAMESQHGIIVERAKGVHAFSHLTFQEYYTAKYSAENAADTFDELMTHITDTRWREVFLLIASLLNKADIFFNKFLGSLSQMTRLNSVVTNMLKYADLRSRYDTSKTNIVGRWLSFYDILDRTRGSALDVNLNLAPALSRAIALDRARARARTLIRALDIELSQDLDPNLNLALALNHNQARDRTRARAFSRDHTLDFDYERERINVNALNLDRDRGHGLNRAGERDRVRARSNARIRVLTLIRDLESLEPLARLDILLFALSHKVWVTQSLPLLIDLTISTARTLHLLPLATSIAEIILPDSDDILGTDSVWLQFRQQIMILASTYWELRFDWKFTQQDVDAINNYLYANTLLVECLKLAVVSDREGIKNRLLMPPDVAG
jgi:hypothetical protein